MACLLQSLTLVLGPGTLFDLVITFTHLRLNTKHRWCLSVWNGFLSVNSCLLRYYAVPIDKCVPIDTAASPRIYESSSTPLWELEFSHTAYHNYLLISSQKSSWGNYFLLSFSWAGEICARLYLNHSCTSVTVPYSPFTSHPYQPTQSPDTFHAFPPSPNIILICCHDT